jgi:predicted N-acetyltransferase YhbS
MRHETPHDLPAVEKLHERAFGPGRFARAAYLLREDSAPHLTLSFVAVIGSLVIGSIRLTPIIIQSAHSDLHHDNACFLGPLTVDPAFEGRGIGRALMRRALEAAQTTGYTHVLLVGDEPYYKQFGFEKIPPYALELPAPVDPQRFLVATLDASCQKPLRGRVRVEHVA